MPAPRPGAPAAPVHTQLVTCLVPPHCSPGSSPLGDVTSLILALPLSTQLGQFCVRACVHAYWRQTLDKLSKLASNRDPPAWLGLQACATPLSPQLVFDLKTVLFESVLWRQLCVGMVQGLQVWAEVAWQQCHGQCPQPLRVTRGLPCGPAPRLATSSAPQQDQLPKARVDH